MNKLDGLVWIGSVLADQWVDCTSLVLDDNVLISNYTYTVDGLLLRILHQQFRKHYCTYFVLIQAFYIL